MCERTECESIGHEAMERVATVRDIEANAESEAARYRELPPAEICALARWLAARVARVPDAP